MQLNVERIKPTAKSIVLTCGGKEYFAKKDSGITAGMTIDAEVEDSDYNGKTYSWVKKWKPLGNAAPAVQGTQYTPAAGAPPVWLQMASNVVAHGVTAGVITDPNQVKAWVLAVKNVVEKGESA